jgi:hypothetical protein
LTTITEAGISFSFDNSMLVSCAFGGLAIIWSVTDKCKSGSIGDNSGPFLMNQPIMPLCSFPQMDSAKYAFGI